MLSSREGSVTASEIDLPWTLRPKGDLSFAALDQQPRALGITWRDLTVQAVAADATIHDNFTSQYNIANKLRDARRKPPLKTILDRSHGCVKPGEMLLVLGRPGSGCTTLLNVLANRRNGYASVEGDVHYGSLPAADAGKYQGQIVMNTEDELFFPSLTVDQTMDFATRLKVPANASRDPEELRRDTRDFLLESMGISHTHTTKLGNEFIRGVSGGERKRVSIVECMATRGSVFCWDNSTRGLDASNALEWARTVRAMTDTLGLASIATLYQAGNGIYHLFDKVLVLDGGKQIFYGPMEEARPFMEFLGFICPEGANVADYLTGVTVPTERRIRPGWEPFFPRTADAVKVEYEASSIFYNMQMEYDYPTSDFARENTRLFQEAVDAEKHRQLPSSSPLTVSFPAQVQACVFRQYQIVWGDKATFIVKQVFTAMQALIMGSLFYNAPANSSGLFVKSGALFFSLLYNALLSMTEVGDSFRGRPILVKHRLFGFYHPAAFCIAQITADIPLILFQVSVFGIILYFMVGFTATAASFFTYWVILVAATMVMTALFRAIGAGFQRFDGAAKLAGLSILSTMLYTGYMIQKPQMHPWFVWIFWINPVAYAFDALLSNEFHGKIIDCVGNSLVPNGPGYFDPEYQSCAGVTGSTQGQTWLTGDQYLGALTYSHTHIWRNLGILVALWALFVMLTVVFTSRWRAASEGGSTLLIPRERSKLFSEPRDEEARATVTEKTVGNSADHPGNVGEQALIRNTSLFTWKNLSYTVKTPEGERVLLDNVQGWVKPGMLGALMGSSGAGKTTLLDVLAQRKTEGTIRGSILVDGRPLPISFQRSAGYCEQLDVHEPYSTVREALEFSALLRQRRDVPREEKLRYVDTIIDLLELHDLADTLIGEPGAGLTIEQRKRVTIGVELVAKPSILIFLDEPTSGLDGQSAYNTVRFLRKLADAGQAVLVTIHQPSAQVFSFFDTLLLLTGGGKTVYFGEIGEGGRTVRSYFERYGAPCPEETNLAEHMIDVVSGSLSQGKDWSEVWLSSPEHEAVTRELDYIIAVAASSPPRTVDDGHEYAMPLWEQLKLVTQRTSLSVYRNTDYVNNKIALHIFGSLFNGFSFWKIGNSVNDLQLRLFTVFNFIFVAPGIINHMQPLFIQRRNIFETREKKSKMYSWVAFVAAIIISEIPYLCICAVLYFACWYFTVGFPHEASRAGSTFFVMLMFEFVYTGIGQFEAAWAPNELFAALVNPVVIGILISFCGVLVPYAQIQPFWRHWLYWINPLNYLTGSILVFSIWDTDVTCTHEELALFDPVNGTTCAEYLAGYMRGMGRGAKLLNPEATIQCEVCPYSSGSTYLQGLNLKEYYYGWRDAGIVVIFALSSYALVFLLMKLRTKRSKKAE